MVMGKTKLADLVKSGKARIWGNAGILKQLASAIGTYDPGFEIMPGTKTRAATTGTAQAGPGITTSALKDELQGAMRSIRKLSPTQEDNFALNDIDNLSKFFDPIFAGMNIENNR